MQDSNKMQLQNQIMGGSCGCNVTPLEGAGCCTPSIQSKKETDTRKIMDVDLLVIDLSTCKRCVPTGDQLRIAIQLLNPVAEALGIELRHHEMVVQTPEEAKKNALISSPTIRLNGHDITQDIRESVCESCGDLTNNNTSIDCREWHYRGKVYSAAPLALLLESLMAGMLKIDEVPPVVPVPLKELPENMKRYFENKKQTGMINCCS